MGKPIYIGEHKGFIDYDIPINDPENKNYITFVKQIVDDEIFISMYINTSFIKKYSSTIKDQIKYHNVIYDVVDQCVRYDHGILAIHSVVKESVGNNETN
ncbi:hypothetical protein LaP1706_gp41 [Lactococcus phage 1706]|uniref:Uncharacterized protein n=1 Tax=Lactococcus phage 1706 TaxID=475178 RepID=B2BTK5_9CAUD|nr:hypothetical protein LaP1706_gp41 [Lactococcus phage 1706]ABV91248.1 unknown [Lactococcus phage 1706]